MAADSQSLAPIFMPGKDKPRVREPYANMVAPNIGIIDRQKVPVGPNIGKRSQGQVALQGLIGAK